MRSRTNLLGFQKPLDDGKRKPVGMALVTYAQDVLAAQCSCGQPFKAKRIKVLEDKIDKHLIKKHRGRGFRL